VRPCSRCLTFERSRAPSRPGGRGWCLHRRSRRWWCQPGRPLGRAKTAPPIRPQPIETVQPSPEFAPAAPICAFTSKDDGPKPPALWLCSRSCLDCRQCPGPAAGPTPAQSGKLPAGLLQLRRLLRAEFWWQQRTIMNQGHHEKLYGAGS
jgi:hypothetical protein